MSVAAKGSDVKKAMLEALEKIDNEIGSAMETIEILSDEKTLKGIEEGLRDIREGNIVAFEDFLKKYGYK